MLLGPGGAACGIGSLPYLTPEPALKLIQKYLPLFPHWPQLPRRGGKEHFIFQNLFALVKQGLFSEGKEKNPYFDLERADWPEKLTSFYHLYLAACEGEKEALAFFAPPEEAAPGLYAFLTACKKGSFPRARYLKGQIPGPLSVALNLCDQQGKPAYYNPHLHDLLLKALALSARWQAETLKEVGPAAIIFVDDPAVGAWGSAIYITLERREIVADLREIVQAIKEGGAIPGAHSCAGGDWSIFLEAGFQILSFDAYSYFKSLTVYHKEVQTFLEQGGVLAWGIVPTSEKVAQENFTSLAKLFKVHLETLAAQGISWENLSRQCLITPSCGTGTLPLPLAEKVYRLTAQLAMLFPFGGN